MSEDEGKDKLTPEEVASIVRRAMAAEEHDPLIGELLDVLEHLNSAGGKMRSAQLALVRAHQEHDGAKVTKYKNQAKRMERRFDEVRDVIKREMKL